MDGVPGLSKDEQHRADASTEIHARSRQVSGRIKELVRQTGLEPHPSSMAWLQPDNATLVRELAAHCAHIARISRGLSAQAFQAWPLWHVHLRQLAYSGIPAVSGSTARSAYSTALHLMHWVWAAPSVTLPSSFPSLSCVAGQRFAMRPAAIATPTTPILPAPAKLQDIARHCGCNTSTSNNYPSISSVISHRA